MIDEDYVKIIGNVELTLTDNETGDIHTIKADSILFNFKEDYLTASGNISYVLEGEKKTENFIGEKITFNVETWEGLFSKGQSEEQQTSDGEEITFYFKGDLINKTEDNYVILEKGEITSCDLEDPHYRLKAEKIWLLTGDEWAMLNGVLYIGRVPILYIPGYLNAGDEIFFNPVFGYMSDYGYYLQTTTYLLGEKESIDSPFSFLQSDGTDEYVKLNGIYLTPDDSPSSEKKDFLSSFSNSDYFKIMFDTYSSRGFYLAAEGDIKSLLFLDNLDIYTALSVTRKIESINGVYTHLFEDSYGVYSSIWESSFFYNIELPFRYGVDLSFGINLDWFDLDFIFQSYSDGDIKNEFSDREENLDLLGMLTEETSTSSSISSITTGSWEVSADIEPDISFLNPFVKTLKIQDLKSSLNWSLKNIETGYEDTVGEFFSPDNFILPGISAEISGSILPFPEAKDTDSEKKDKDNNDEELELLPPWEEETKNKNDETEDGLSDMRPSVSTSSNIVQLDSFDNTLTYSIAPVYSGKTQLNTSEWADPLDIDLSSAEYSFMKFALNASLTYDADIMDDFLTLGNTLKFTGNYNNHYDMDLLPTETVDTYLLEDKQATSMGITNNLTIIFNPFRNISEISGTRVNYIFNSTVYDYDYSTDSNGFVSSFFEFSSENITSHKIQIDFPLDIYNLSQKLTLTSTLPPLTFIASGTFSLDYGPSYTTLNTAVQEVDNVLEFDPLAIYEKFTIFDSHYISNNVSLDYTDFTFDQNIFEGYASFDEDQINFKTKFIYDFSDNTPSELTANLNFYDFYINFTASNTYNYVFDLDSGWIQQDNKSFQASSFNTGIKIKPEPIIFWKNRINFDFSVSADIDYNLIEFSDSIFNFDLNLNLDIFDFLTLKVTSSSENTQIFRYIDAHSTATGQNTLDIFDDLIKSFNFFNIQDRYDSNFNLENITIGLSHDLHDWSLNLDYSGYPDVNDDLSPAQYEWVSKLDIYLEWKAVDDIKSEISIDDGEVSF